MVNYNTEISNVTQDDILQMIDNTSKLVVEERINQLSNAAVAAKNSSVLVDNVEFWKWLERNYRNSGIFETPMSMQNYISQGASKEAWILKQLQGKGFEWDWMTEQRGDIKNILNTYYAGDVANRAASDVTERSILTGKSNEYQMKAYVSDNVPKLKNTPKDMTVVTNSEKVNAVQKKGYQSVEEFQDAQKIKDATRSRMDQIKDGKSYTNYNISNVASTMFKAGIVGGVIGMGTEAVILYNSWKAKQISNEEYLKEILKAGGNAGVASGVTAGIMIPVSATITAMGASTLITVPIAFVLGSAVNKIVAPAFARGDYQKYLQKAHYYQKLEDVYDDLIVSMQRAADEYFVFVHDIYAEQLKYRELQNKNAELDESLKNIYLDI